MASDPGAGEEVRRVAERARLRRILDANRNRALEALRVVEEHARFVLEAPRLSGRAKRLRHALHAALDRPHLSGLAERDVVGDPGRPGRADAPAEADRADLAAVLGANLSRAKEACRALEEYAKPLDPAAAAAVSQVRYGVYALEQDLLAGPAGDWSGRGVYVLLGSGPGRPSVLEQARACLRGGVRLFQLREKGLPDGALLTLARDLVALLAEADAWLIVNDRPDLARLAGARGVHLGQEDLAPAEARRLLGPAGLVGLSVHDEAELDAALAAEVDCVGFGTLFASPTKPDLPARGLDLLRRLAPRCPAPIYGIGGVSAANAGAVIAAGAHGVAVSSAVLDARDPTAAARELVAAVEAAREEAS